MNAIALDPHGGVRATMMLADAAQVADGKLNMLGAGWTVIGPGPATFAIAGQFHVSWPQTNREHTFRFELVDLDGAAVELPAPDGGGTTTLTPDGKFEVGRPPGVKPGTTIPMPFVVPFTNVPLPPGGWFEWRLSINGRDHEDWRLPFATRPALGEGQEAA